MMPMAVALMEMAKAALTKKFHWLELPLISYGSMSSPPFVIDGTSIDLGSTPRYLYIKNATHRDIKY